jgi:UDP-4-amino-4,6-dideoxy-N-acetyl-beta-L-altrosamine N-acetyltransferase
MIAFREIHVSDAKQILDWRTKARVTEYMDSDVTYDIESQEKWLENSCTKPSYYHWIIQYGGKDVGLLNFVDWDKDKRITSWGFYIGDDDSLGIGGLVPPYFYNFAFNVLGVETVNADVFYNNVDIIRLHLAQGYRFDTNRDHVIKKNGKDVLMVCMNLDKIEFKASKFSRLKTNLPIDRWSYRGEVE